MANMISRENLSGLIPEPVTRGIIQGAIQRSAVLSMGRRLPNMTSKTQHMNVLDALPVAYWVSKYTGRNTEEYSCKNQRNKQYCVIILLNSCKRKKFGVRLVSNTFKKGA